MQNTRSLPYLDLFEAAAEALTFEPESADADVTAAGDDAVRFGELACVRALVPALCDVEQVGACCG